MPISLSQVTCLIPNNYPNEILSFDFVGGTVIGDA